MIFDTWDDNCGDDDEDYDDNSEKMRQGCCGGSRKS